MTTYFARGLSFDYIYCDKFSSIADRIRKRLKAVEMRGNRDRESYVGCVIYQLRTITPFLLLLSQSDAKALDLHQE